MGEIRKRFLKYVQKTPKCWLWIGSRNKKNYGEFSFKGKRERAHRTSYKIFIGDFDEKLIIRHTCDNPPCVNPKHLRVGTHSDNQIDAVIRGRHSTQKLKISDIKRIRKLLANGYSSPVIGEMYGLTGSAIRLLKQQKTWKFV